MDQSATAQVCALSPNGIHPVGSASTAVVDPSSSETTANGACPSAEST